MARLKDIAEGVKDLFKFDPRKIHVDPAWNVRQRSPELEAHIQSLMASIREVGVLEPLTVFVKDNEPWLTNGFCRHEAVMRLIAEGCEIKSVPMLTEERYSSEADRVLSMITRNSGKSLTPLESAMVFKRLLGYGWSVAEIASKSGKSTTHVENMLSLTAAPAPIAEMVREGSVSASCAVSALKEHGPEKAVTVLQEAKATAAACGKSKVTPKHVATKAVNWVTVGPELKVMLEQIVAATGKEREELIQDATTFLAGTFPNQKSA